LDGEELVYDLETDTAVQLNRTAALVWRGCDGRRTVEDLAALVEVELGETADEDAVLMALDSLWEHGLISSGYEERDGAAVALSRRRFFRRAGVVGAAVLNAPVVYSMSAPLAAAALSGGGSGQLTQSTQTFSNTGAGNTGGVSTGTATTGTGGSGTGNTGSGNTGAGNTGAGNTGGGNTGGGNTGGGASSGGGSNYP
jgi:hypothetical protein